MSQIEDGRWRIADRRSPSSSILHSRFSSVPFRRLLVVIGRSEDCRFVKMFADDLQADGQAVSVKAAG
jgi:hypothetical protein